MNTSKFNRYDSDNTFSYETWGLIQNDCININYTKFQEFMRDRNYNEHSFLSWAKRKNKLIHNPGRNKHRVRINGNNIYCVSLRREDEREDEDVALTVPIVRTDSE